MQSIPPPHRDGRRVRAHGASCSSPVTDNHGARRRRHGVDEVVAEVAVTWPSRRPCRTWSPPRVDLLRERATGASCSASPGRPAQASRRWPAAIVASARIPATGVVVPMDGFHLTRAQIAGTPLLARRGAPGHLRRRRLRGGRPPHPERAPTRTCRCRRSTTSSATRSRTPSRCPPGTRLVIVEGNYLLHPAPGWSAARAQLDAVWYLDTPADVRRARLEARHRAARPQPPKTRRGSSPSPTSATPS